jgi:hypothetical protein
MLGLNRDVVGLAAAIVITRSFAKKCGPRKWLRRWARVGFRLGSSRRRTRSSGLLAEISERMEEKEERDAWWR